MPAWHWLLIGALVGLLIGGVRQNRHLHNELLKLRERLASERSSHYQTYTRQRNLERKIGVLLKESAGLAEIAQGSAKLAQIYETLVAEVRTSEQDSRPAPLDYSNTDRN